MHKVGVIGLGNMGSGLAKNLIKSGFETWGLDIDEKRMQAFIDIGGKLASSVSEMGHACDAVYVMVMNGDQAKNLITGKDGLATSMHKGSVVILTATIKPIEAQEIGVALDGSGINLIDSPVSGGFPGAQGGTLTMMAAGKDEVLKKYRPVIEAVSATIHQVGNKAGQGQAVKACLQTVIGSIFAANFEASVLAAKAGISGKVIHEVFSTSSAGCGATNVAMENIINRTFEGTGSHIATMHKDLTISLDTAEQLGVPLHMASSAMQIFHAGKTKYPNGDNWVCTRVIEEIVGAELHR